MSDSSRADHDPTEESSILKQRIKERENSDLKRNRTEHEMTILADIGRVIGSTLEIEEVYELTAVEIRKLIHFDSLTVNLRDTQKEMLVVAYVFGLDIPGRRVGDSFPVSGTMSEEVIRTLRGAILQPEYPEDLVHKFPSLVVSVREGMRSVMSVPLISRDKAIGCLIMRSNKPKAYTDQDLRLAEKIGLQIAGAIANAQLFNDLKKTETSLRESEERLKKAQEISHVGSWELDLSKNRLIWSDEVYRIFGLQPNEFLATYVAFLDSIHPDDRSAVDAAYSNSLREGRDSYEIEHRVIRKHTHEVRYVHERCEHVRDASGRIVRSVGMVQDITDRKQMEETLLESEENYRILLQESTDPIFSFTPEGQYKYVNRAFAKGVGKPIEDIIGKTIWDVFPKDEADKRFTSLSQVFVTGKEKVIEVRVPRTDGDRYYITTITPIKDTRGEIRSAICSSKDITDRKRAEQELTHSHNLMRYIIEHNRSCIAVHDRNLKYIYVSQHYLNDYKVKQKDVIGKHHYDVFPDLPQKWREVHQKALAGQILSAEDDPYVREDGTVDWTRWECRPWYETDGSIGGIIIYTEVITDRKREEEERKRLEQRMRHLDKLESIGTLVGGIAHDFNNLLMGIQGYASLMLLDLDPSHPHYERLKRIEEQVQSGADLTKQLLGFAREGRYEVKPVDMNEIIEKSSSMFGRTKKEISIYRKYGKDLWSVEVDRGQMEQVFMNLYVNAWQAMPRGGEIYLETDNVLLDDEQADLSAIRPGKYVKISVTDTGSGMDEKTRARIFDPFFTTKGMGRGTGLGLATVYGIIKGHKGAINVESEPGRGATFTIYLPASERVAKEEKTATETIARGAETILLVDDEKMILEVSKDMLEYLGYKVYVAGSGQEALAVYMEKQKVIDLVILDMIMPGLSGGEAFDRLRAINPVIRVLLSSGYSIDGQAREILNRGCNGFLQKPFHLEKLSRSVREVLD